VFEGDGVRGALRVGFRRLARGPARTIVLGLAGTASLVVVLAVTGLAVGATWNALGGVLSIGEMSAVTILLLLLFVALFAGGLVLLGLVCAWRAAIWTMDVGGTFGGGSGTRTGD
jgi:hypothetical protein